MKHQSIHDWSTNPPIVPPNVFHEKISFGTLNFYTKDVIVIFTLDPLGKMIQFHEYVFQTGASTTAKRNLKVR